MAEQEFKTYVPAETSMAEFTLKAVIVGAIFSIVLGSANAYLGLKAGMTVAATFPAAVMAMAVLRVFNGTILEENICRTTAAVGEALVAGAIFTIPAFLIATDPATGEKIWSSIKWGQSTALMLVGGVLGVLFVVFLRRILLEDKTLPFPESVACSEIVKAGQKGQTGAKYVFGSIGLAAVIELFKNNYGLELVTPYIRKFFPMTVDNFRLVTTQIKQVGASFTTTGGAYFETPAASPAMLGVGYIIGPRLSAIVFSGGVFGWLLLVPLLVFIDSTFGPRVAAGEVAWLDVCNAVWNSQVRPLAVGAMLVGAFYTLFMMRKSLGAGIVRAVRDMKKVTLEGEQQNRLEMDIPSKWVVFGIIFLVVPIFFIYYFFSGSIGGALLAAVVMTLAGFLFAAVAGYLVGTIGSSNNPISGLTLSTLIVAALLMVLIGVKGAAGIAAVLGVAAVVCCSSGVAGDITQDLKVGHILGGTPWKMELGCIIGVIAAALVMVFPLQLLHEANQATGGIGGDALPAPQAGLMAMLSQGIIGGGMAWPLVLVGILFSVGLILIRAPSPMLIAVGMYLPFHTTAAIFVGGIIKWIVDNMLAKREIGPGQKERVDNTGILLASGLIAGEALMGIIIAFFVVSTGNPIFKIIPGGSPWLAPLIFVILGYVLIRIPLKAIGEA